MADKQLHHNINNKRYAKERLERFNLLKQFLDFK
jgi:hypothetical protein